MAGNIVPLDAVPVEVVEDGHAGLLLPALLHLLPVVWLRSASPARNHYFQLYNNYDIPSSVRPIMELVAISWGHFYLVSRPEPPVDQLGEELWFVAATKIAFPARSPEVRHAPCTKKGYRSVLLVSLFITIYEPLDPVVLLLGLEGDEVHAALPAVVPRVEPVPLGVPHLSAVILPAHVVIPATKPVNSSHTRS